jgi:phenylpyruvate tautomerase PptA (4-oxalocrotonate tautomerase family)
VKDQCNFFIIDLLTTINSFNLSDIVKMPLWRVFSNPSIFSADQRRGLAKAITDLYVRVGLPAFYVNVIFIDVAEDHLWIGGEPKKNFVRIAVEQIARTMADPNTPEGAKARKGWMDMINEV